MLKVLRPLRLIRRYEGLRMAIDALIKSFKHIINILCVSAFLFVVFGTIGVNFFKGLYFYCDYENVRS